MTTPLKTAQALVAQSMKTQLDAFLEGEAAKCVRNLMLMPTDFDRHYDNAKRAVTQHQATGEPLGWLVWTAQPGASLDDIVRLYAVSRSCQGLPLPRLRKRRARKEVAHVHL